MCVIHGRAALPQDWSRATRAYGDVAELGVGCRILDASE